MHITYFHFDNFYPILVIYLIIIYPNEMKVMNLDILRNNKINNFIIDKLIKITSIL